MSNRHPLVIKLKSGEYTGADLMEAWLLIESQSAEIERLRDALRPFAHPDLRLRLGGNATRDGDQAIVFQRNRAYMRLRDFDTAASLLDGGNDRE